jgi:Holliday junction resolvase
MNSRSKGCRGEREWRDVLRDAGLEARRGQQFAGGTDSPDVICRDMPGIHFEVKRVQALNVGQAMSQAIRDAKHEKIPVVAHRKNGEDWLVTMRAADWLEMVKQTPHVKPRSETTPPQANWADDYP